MKIYKIETDDVFFTGDLHGRWEMINVCINQYNLENCAIVFCGDIGVGFEKEEFYNQTFNKITKTLKKKNIHIYMFRGNHDNPMFFDGEHFNTFKYVHVIPDYSILQTPSNNILCIGGATSIDRYMRKNANMINEMKYKQFHNNASKEEVEANYRKVYWEGEAIVYDEEKLSEITNECIKIDTVCTHTSPSFCYPLSKDGIQGWLLRDPSLQEDLDNERKECNKILDFLIANKHPLTRWYYGHFHFHNVEIIDGVKYTLLDMTREKMDLTE